MELVTKQKVEALFSPALTGKTTYTADEILLTLQTMPTVDAIPIGWLKEQRKIYRGFNWEMSVSVIDEIIDEWGKENETEID